MAAPVVPFLNLQYFYCLIAGILGKGCAKDVVTVPDINVDVGGATTTVTNAVTNASADAGGFWSWLWPFGSGAGDAATAVGTTSAADVGFWTGAFNAMPEFVQSILLGIGAVFSFLWSVVSWTSYSLSALLFLVIMVALGGLILIRMREWQALNTLPPRTARDVQSKGRWQDLLNEAMSTDPKRWKMAILAADDMLGVLLTRIGYHGKTTGDQMRGIPDGAFVTLPAAWEAHRVKNFVASRASNFILTQREAFRVMKLYEQVFEEFDFI